MTEEERKTRIHLLKTEIREYKEIMVLMRVPYDQLEHKVRGKELIKQNLEAGLV